MYEKSDKIKLPSSTTLLPNNLSKLCIESKAYLGTIHIGEFIIVNTNDGVINRVCPKISPTPAILQASWVDIGAERPLLVLAAVGAVQIFDWDGSVLLFTHIISPPNQSRESGFFRGICSFKKSKICIGMHSGEILILNSTERDGSSIYIEDKVRWLSHAVTSLAANENFLAAADSSGCIVIAEESPASGLQKARVVDTYGSCVNCLEIFKDAVIAGYVSGHIRIFNLTNGKITAEVCAHARSLSGLDIARETGMLLSVAEDTFARVWKIDSSQDISVEHKYSKSEPNEVLSGGRFLDGTACTFFLSAYDLPFLISYIM